MESEKGRGSEFTILLPIVADYREQWPPPRRDREDDDDDDANMERFNETVDEGEDDEAGELAGTTEGDAPAP